MSSKVLRLLFVGAPGVGKGTYSSRAAAALKVTAISSGDLLRHEVAEGTVTGKAVKDMIEKGIFVPDATVTELVAKRLATLDTPAGYILDGYPRNITQAQTLWSGDAVKIDHVINLTQPRNVIIAKMSSRRMCPKCGFVYNAAKIDEGGIKMDPLMPKVDGVCDKCGCTEPLTTRKDDQLEVVVKRQDEYEATAEPMLAFYRDKGVLHDFAVLGGTKVYLPKLLEMIRSL